jgi:hypothetical protein
MRYSAETQSFLDPSLRAAALPCTAGFKWRALQRQEKKQQVAVFSCLNLRKYIILSFFNRIFKHTFVPLQRLCFQATAAALGCSACVF